MNKGNELKKEFMQAQTPIPQRKRKYSMNVAILGDINSNKNYSDLQ